MVDSVGVVERWLVCGTRGNFKDYKKIVMEKLTEKYQNRRGMKPKEEVYKVDIIEGCCTGSADEYA